MQWSFQTIGDTYKANKPMQLGDRELRRATAQRIAAEMGVGGLSVRNALRELRPKDVFIDGDFHPLDVRRIRRHIELQQRFQEFSERFTARASIGSRWQNLRGVALSLEEASGIIGVDAAAVAPVWGKFASHTDEDLVFYSRDRAPMGYLISVEELAIFLGLSSAKTKEMCERMGLGADSKSDLIPVASAESVRVRLVSDGFRPGLRIRRVFSPIDGGLSAAILPALVDLSLQVGLDANAKMFESESDWIIARSDSLLARFRPEVSVDRRKRIVRANALLYEEALALGLDDSCLRQVARNHFDMGRTRRSDGEVVRVMDRLFAGERYVAAELLSEIVAPNAQLPEDAPELHLLIERLWSKRWESASLTKEDIRLLWCELGGESDGSETVREAAREQLREQEERARAGVDAWIAADPSWMDDAHWPIAQQRRAGQFLAGVTTGWLSRDSEVEFRCSPQMLERLLIAIHEVLPRAEQRKLIGQPIAVNAGGIRIVSWVRSEKVFSWVGLSEGAVAVSLDLRRFVVAPSTPSSATLVASTLAAAWFLDSLLLTTGLHSPHYGTPKVGRWAKVTDDFLEPKVRAARVLAQFDLHQVRQHLRTLPIGQQPSDEAIARAPEFLRRQMRPDQTYVRASLRGSDRLFRDVQRFSSQGSFLADVIFAARRR